MYNVFGIEWREKRGEGKPSIQGCQRVSFQNGLCVLPVAVYKNDASGAEVKSGPEMCYVSRR